MTEDQQPAPEDGSREISDLIGVELTAAIGIWLLIVLVAFFLIGPVTGIVAIGVGMLAFGWMIARAISRADTSD